MSYQPVYPEKDRDGLPIIMSTLTSVQGARVLVFNVSVWPETGLCQVYFGGWTDDKVMLRVKGPEQGLTVMKRGWMKSLVALEAEGKRIRCKTSNEFGDLLRKHYGSDALLDFEPGWVYWF